MVCYSYILANNYNFTAKSTKLIYYVDTATTLITATPQTEFPPVNPCQVSIIYAYS